MRLLMVIPPENFADCFEKWNKIWDKHVDYQEEYFERG